MTRTKGVKRTRTREGIRLFSELAKFASKSVAVGFLNAELAERAAYNEFGTEDVPERPFLTQSASRWRDEEILSDAVDEIFAGRSADQALERAGARAVGVVQETITEGGFVPNAPATVAAKGSSTPLVDTGAMRQGVAYEVVPAGSTTDDLSDGEV